MSCDYETRVLRINGKKNISIEQLIQLNNRPVVPCLESSHDLIDRFKDNGVVVRHRDGSRKRRKKKKYFAIKKPKKEEKQYYSEKYWIECIVDIELNYRSDLLYFIKWKGYDNSDNTWQSVDDLFDCNLSFEQFFANLFTTGDVIHYTIDDWNALYTCLCETVSESADIAILLKLNDKRVNEYNRTPEQIDEMKDNINKFYNAIKRMRLIDERIRKSHNFWPQKILIQYIVRELKIEKNFGDLAQFLSFVEERRKLMIKLNEWETDINRQIVDKGIKEDWISVENIIDFKVPPKIQYITDYKMHSKLSIVHTNIERVCCDCEENCRRVSACVCAEKLFSDSNRFQSWNVIYECNDNCKCNSDLCPNRRIQKHRIGSELMVFRTERCGWGLMTKRRIEFRSFIMSYIGIVIDSKETAHRDPTYFFNIDQEFCGQTLFIDSKYYGNISRFANHCCEPNMDLYMSVINNTDLVPRIAFFANRTIEPFEELTYEYSRQTLSTDSYGNYVPHNIAEDSVSQDSGYSSNCSHDMSSKCINTGSDDILIKCFCGKTKCKQFI